MEIHEESPEEGENEQRTETEERRVAAILRDLSFFVLFISCFFKRVAGQRVRCGKELMEEIHMSLSGANSELYIHSRTKPRLGELKVTRTRHVKAAVNTLYVLLVKYFVDNNNKQKSENLKGHCMLRRVN